MGVRMPFPTAFDHQEAIDKAVRPYRAALNMILAESACAQELVVEPREALAEIDRVAEAALRCGGCQ